MTLAPEIQPYVDSVASAELPSLAAQPIEQVRDQSALFAHVGAHDAQPVDVVEDRTIPGPAGEIPVRVYDSQPASTSPVVAYFHGGGFVMMGLDTHDRVCRRLANATGAVIVSVDYRLAPEHRFPAALDDCMAVTHWLTEHAAELAGDPGRVAVAGDSAGGNLAAATALASRNGGPRLAAQVLVYPVIDAGCDTES
ncbi:MAG TPA: alpha/beta hydrolase, partial [Acidimicrobiia bacterium]